MTKTLADYIAFLRENGFEQDAHYFETEVVAMLGQFGCEKPLELDADVVPKKLYEIQDALSAELAQIQNMGTNKKWDVVLT